MQGLVDYLIDSGCIVVLPKNREMVQEELEYSINFAPDEIIRTLNNCWEIEALLELPVRIECKIWKYLVDQDDKR